MRFSSLRIALDSPEEGQGWFGLQETMREGRQGEP